MNRVAEVKTYPTGPDVGLLLNALPHPVLSLAPDGKIFSANDAAQAFFQRSSSQLRRVRIADLVPFGSPILHLIEQARDRNAPVKEYRIDLGTPNIGMTRLVDIYAAPIPDDHGHVLLMLEERTMADKIERQLSHRGAARSVTGLAAMLAHEIKNPLSGIRGAAQLLDSGLSDEDRMLTRLITDEADRIVKLVDRMEVFSDDRPIEREPVNVHSVLEHVKTIARSGFARNIKISEFYDPSLPPVYGNRDQLVQVFLNLIKNAAEGIGDSEGGEIALSSAFQPGIRISVPGTRERIGLPLEFCVRDNGKGVPPELRAHLFDPFVTTKASGSGLGLALVAKIIGDHGGVVECDSEPGRTVFRVLLPMAHMPESETAQDKKES
ncbi:MAG: nitrogen regulation protein NR(II) [Rhodobiaceae bacterium]|nr:nitrogen regulation protein NR(II) [Rhodobiaceae bacterium]